MTPHDCEVVVVGAGLAGLAAARVLLAAGRDVHVIEASDGVGGRVRTDHVDGLTLDRGFQLHNDGYRSARALLDHAALDLRPLSGGIAVAGDGGVRHIGDPRHEPLWALESMVRPAAPRAAQLRFAAHTVRAAFRRAPDTAADEAALDFLLRQFGPGLTRGVLQPFLSGVFLEDDLAVSRRHLDRVLRGFVRGRPCVPAAGMSAIPEQLAAGIDAGRIHLHQRVTNVAPGRVTTDAATIGCHAVVLATDARSAAHLLPTLEPPAMRAVTTWYHIADCDPAALTGGRPTLVVDSRRFAAGTPDPRRPLANSVVLTHAAPEYASDARVLVSSSAVGRHDDTASELAVLDHLSQLYGVATSGWTLAATYVVADALPATRPGRAATLPAVLGTGLFVAGDWRDAASIDGALASGRRAAAAVLAD